MDSLRLEFEPLERCHDRAAFSSGAPALDDYLKTKAGQDVRRGVARVFVAVPPGKNEIAGYYTLGSFAITFDEMPTDIARKLPPYGEIPAALIGRLARDLRWKGKGVGELLLADAINRTIDAARRLAIFAIVVDAKDEAAADFYRSFGFKPQVTRPMRLFLPLATASAAKRNVG